jgi:hypothetical protein
MEDETLETVAPEEGQPTDEAVAQAPSAEADSESETAAAPEGQPAPSRLYAGKYKSPEELEQSYLESQREASRMAGELASYRKIQQQPQTASEPEWKKLEAERNKWAQYAAQPGLTEDQRANAWNQVSLHDRQIAEERAFERFQTHSTKQSATQKLEARALGVISQYQQDLSPGSELYQAAEALYYDMVRGGYPDSVATKALAVREAADELGIQRSRAVAKDRKGFLDNLNKQAKAAVKVGAGTATVVKPRGITAQEINDMDDAKFAKFEREHVLGA